jgi:hypothetical protein
MRPRYKLVRNTGKYMEWMNMQGWKWSWKDRRWER